MKGKVLNLSISLGTTIVSPGSISTWPEKILFPAASNLPKGELELLSDNTKILLSILI